MELNQVDERLPDFECSIDPNVLARMTETDRLIATTQDRQWQALRYVYLVAARAHNMGVQTARTQASQSENIRKLIFGVVASIVTAIAITFINARTKG